MSDFVKIPSTPEVWAVIHASHKGRLQLYSSFSDPTDLIQSVLPEMLRDRSTPGTWAIPRRSWRARWRGRSPGAR